MQADTIGIVAALPEELAALGARLERPRDARLGGLEVRRGGLAGREVWLAVGGVGRQQAAAGVARLLAGARGEIGALLGVGVAGGLTADLRAGEVVVAERVLDPEGEVRTPPAWRWSGRAAALEGAAGGTVVTVDRIAAGPDEKGSLARRFALGERAVVDMESSSWAAAASARDLPWLVLRAVSDAADERLPLDFERFRNRGGEVSRSAVLAHALTRPRVMLELDRLRRRVRACAGALADRVEELLAW